jgi:RimJ/RimL family protein N-acetyltransferase
VTRTKLSSNMPTCPSEIVTPRLRLRRLKESDTDAFIVMNADVNVMEFFPHPWSIEESKAALSRIQQAFDDRGFGIYAIETSDTFLGIVGLSVPSFDAPFTPCIEILWRLGFPWWGKGYATEAAEAVLRMAFQTLSLKEVVAFTTRNNLRSIGVMKKLGMVRDRDGDFDHPAIQEASLKPHVLYRLSAGSNI